MARPNYWNLVLQFSLLLSIYSILAAEIPQPVGYPVGSSKDNPPRAEQGVLKSDSGLPQLQFANQISNGKFGGDPVSVTQKSMLKMSQEVPEDGAKPKKKEHMKIADTRECGADVTRFCSDKANSNNFVILDCLQNDEKTASELSDDCHHFLWKFKLKLTRDSRFEDASNEACATEFDKFPECKNVDQGEAIPCLIEHYEEIRSKPCSTFLNKMASIIFSDYRFMNFFLKDCKKDINNLKCGRLELGDTPDDSPHSQGKTVTCLTQHKKELTKTCKKSLLRVAELQSVDFHLDRPIYYACKNDRENLCQDVVAGGGEVYKCLYQHLGDEKLSDNCRTKLEERQQLIAEDVKADKSFYEACKDDIVLNKCAKKQYSADDDIEEDLSRSSILLCLEEAHSETKKVKSECLQEMFELRSELMQDYKISPELVNACQNEIDNVCNGLKRGGNTLQCLMKRASQRNRNADKEEKFKFSSECFTEVRKLLRIANPGENIRLDAPLQRACGDVVSQACSHYRAGHGDIITCLLENLDHEDMTDECEDELLVIQYFAARDFRLDFHLFRQCHGDAEKLCNFHGFSDPKTMTPEQGPVVFSCLHRHLRSNDPNDLKPSRPCIHEIKRVMRERSLRMNLMPEVEDACLGDLSQHCSDNDEHTEVGGEMGCLQKNLKDLSEKCRQVISNFTEEEAEDIEMDRILMKSCTPMIKRFCNELLNSDAIPNEVLDCLIEHKNRNDMDEKCAAGVEHHQIISLQDFRFNMKFREACQASVAINCKNKKTKYEVIACLSEHIRNDTLLEKPQRIDERCKKQLKFELLQRGETINLDPELKKECGDEIQTLCGNKRAGEGEVVECLRAHKRKLSDNCHKLLFKREKDDAMFGDYTLLHMCKKMIKQYCDVGADEADILNCLKANKNNDDFDDRCRQIVLRRQVEQAQDIRLNPHLQKACRLDIPKFCAHMYNDGLKDGELEGKVIDCLRKKYASKTKMLTKDCEHEIQSRVKEAALNINLNPVLMISCKTDISYFCKDEIANIKHQGSDDTNAGYEVFGNGAIMECLKKNFRNLKSDGCRKELAYAVAESRIDVHVDPLLNSACQQDLITNCKEISQGQGRKMSCLLSYLESAPNSLTRNCRDMLQRRKDLWEYAAQVAPAETFSEVFAEISSSPARNYFFAILFTVVGVIFIVGLTCGRVTKRVRAEIKNK